MADRELVELVLELKDEASQALKDIRRELRRTGDAAEDTKDAFGGITVTLGDVMDIAGLVVDGFASLGRAALNAADAVKQTRLAMGDLADQVDLERLAGQATVLEAKFGVALPESIGATRALMRNFGITSDEAIQVVTAGLAEGLNASGDFLESIGEYSNQFASGGASVDQFFNVLQSGLNDGILGTDKAADAFKEFQVRILDGSETTSAGLEQLGLDSQQILRSLSDGTLTAADAFGQVVTAIQATEDPRVRMQAGFALMGAPFEDMGNRAVENLSLTGQSMEDLARIAEETGSQFNSLEEAGAAISEAAMPALNQAIEELLPLIEMLVRDMIVPFIQTYGPTLVTLIGDFANGVGFVFLKLKPLIDFINNEGKTSFEALAAAIKGDYVTAANLASEANDQFQDRASGLADVQDATTDALGNTVEALQREIAAASAAARASDEMAQSALNMGNAADTASIDLQALADDAARAFQAGAQEFEALVQGEVRFLAEREEAQAQHNLAMEAIDQQRIAAVAATGAEITAARRALSVELADIDNRLGDELASITQDTHSRLLEIDQESARERAAAQQDLRNETRRVLSQTLADMEANDLELVGAAEDRQDELRFREDQEHQRKLALQKAALEAEELATRGQGELAQELFKIRQQQIGKLESLDEAYQQKRQELADNPELLAILEREYQQAVAAQEQAAQQEVNIAQNAAQQRIADQEAEKQAVLAAAEVKKQAAIAAAEVERQAAQEAAATQIAAAQQTLAIQQQGFAERAAAEQASFLESEARAAAQYAEQQAQQRAHLGQMLIDYTELQAQINGVSAEKTAEMTMRLQQEYGVQQSSTEQSFAQMASVIDQWAQQGQGSVDEHISTLNNLTAEAAATQQAYNQDIHEMATQATQDFQSGGQSVDAYTGKLNTGEQQARTMAQALLDIPSEVKSMVIIEKKIKEVVERAAETGQEIVEDLLNPEGRQRGGSVRGGRLYEVNEGGMPELLEMMGRQFLMMPPGANGDVTPLAAGNGAGGNVTVNIQATVSNDMDMDMLARNVVQAIQRNRN